MTSGHNGRVLMWSRLPGSPRIMLGHQDHHTHSFIATKAKIDFFM